MSWGALRRNIEINRFYDERDLVALDVHYAFLSGFVHATQDGYVTVFGPAGALDTSASGDVAEELVHLYVATLGAAELRLLCRMGDRQPPVRIDDRDALERLCARAESEAGHLWFAGGAPHSYDVVTEWNRRTWRRDREEGGTGRPALVAAPSLEELRFPGDSPAERLKGMHQSYQELTTGLSYDSPWPTLGR